MLTLPKHPILNLKELRLLVQQRTAIYDKSGDSHYNLISALHKSLRGSDVNAALYWFARMQVAGEDLRYIGRRLIRFASEDIGLADPNALSHAINGFHAYEKLGSPEGDLALFQVIIYLATSPKSNSVYNAEIQSKILANKTNTVMPP